MYTLDLVTILRLLREFQRSGILQTRLPSGLQDLKLPCVVVIELLRGEMTACHVKDIRGQTLLADQEAFEAISVMGKLNWTFEALPEHELLSRRRITGLLPAPSTHLSAGPPQTPLAASTLERPAYFSHRPLVPRRLFSLNQHEINSWPRRHRQVYVLIDGVRSVEKIAAMLSQPPHMIEKILREIESVGVIVLRNS